MVRQGSQLPGKDSGFGYTHIIRMSIEQIPPTNKHRCSGQADQTWIPPSYQDFASCWGHRAGLGVCDGCIQWFASTTALTSDMQTTAQKQPRSQARVRSATWEGGFSFNSEVVYPGYVKGSRRLQLRRRGHISGQLLARFLGSNGLYVSLHPALSRSPTRLYTTPTCPEFGGNVRVQCG